MTVRELFQKIDKEAFFRDYLSHDGAFAVKLMESPKDERDAVFNRYKETILQTFDLFASQSGDSENCIIFVVPYSEYDDYPDVFYVKSEELLGSESPKYYACDFDRKDILSCSISHASLQLLSEIKIARALFYEMTFLGYDDEEYNKRVDEITQSLEESMRDIENNRFISSDELFASLGYTDTRTDAEKQFEFDIMRLNCDSCKKIRDRMFEFERKCRSTEYSQNCSGILCGRFS